MTRVFLWGAYKQQRELTWLFGVALLLITMAAQLHGRPPAMGPGRAIGPAGGRDEHSGVYSSSGQPHHRAYEGWSGHGTAHYLSLFHTACYIASDRSFGLIVLHIVAFRVTAPWVHGGQKSG